MNFNPSKCKVLSVTRSHAPFNFTYSINGQPLEHVGVFKDLGILIDQSLSFNQHVTNLVTKCNRVNGMIKRSVGFKAPSHVKLTLFNSLCRSHLEYCSQVWSPFNKSKVLSLESVQRSMTRFILSNALSYNERCASLTI
jgi:hypothetical protein